MGQRHGASKLLVLSFVALALAGVAGNYALDLQRRNGRRAATQTNSDLRAAEQGLAELRTAEAAYLAAGSNVEAATAQMDRATTAGAQIENAIAALGATTRSADARGHYQNAASIAGEVLANDKKARGLVSSGQAMVASDVVLIEGADPVTRLSTELATARDLEMAQFEKRATQLGWIGTAGNGALMLIGLLLFLAASRRGEVDDEAPSGSLTSIVERPASSADLASPGHDGRADTPADFQSTADLCVDLGRVAAGTELPGLLARAATVLEAKGLVLWVRDEAGSSLRPSLAHGYSDKIVQKMGTLPADSDNVTALAYRTRQPQFMTGSNDGRGAIAVPLLSADGCVGVLAAEVPQAAAEGARAAMARIIAAQLSTIVGPAVSAAQPNSTAGVTSSVQRR